MAGTPPRPERIDIAPGLNASRIIIGLWQVADIERTGTALDPDQAADELARYAAAGFDTFDMADHYGSAEIIAGRLLMRAGNGQAPPALVFTKWCPEPGPMISEVVEAGVKERLARLGTDTVDLLQLHWWTYEHPAYLDALAELARLREQGRIRHIGVTNFNTDHLRVIIGQGYPVVTNQVCYSLLDRRAGGDMADFCLANNIKLICYGTLAGGFLSETWLGRPEPSHIGDWSKMKYKRFIDAIGGWGVLQQVLQAAAAIARKHGVSIANVATRWALDQPAVGAVIIGARLGESEHREDNAAVFSFALDEEDRSVIGHALAQTKPIPGDCGDEYRKPPYLTASGDLSHHLSSLPKVYTASAMPGRPRRWRVDSGSVWEPVAGYSRAIRSGDRILVSGTTATHSDGSAICAGDPAGQTVYILDKIAASLSALGGSLHDVVRTWIYVANASDWEPVARVHGRYLGHIRPANTLIEAGGLIGDYLVEIEAEAELAGTE